ncbi:MAG TPA: peroxiredoxin [Rhodobacteraceae bacterium]|nr:peroxiredoxin [Paracoccaceae bacterium]
MTEIGQSAPDFTLPATGGTQVTLSALRPKTVVLYFYPKDDTPGCTIEAVDFSALADEFAARNAVVLGVSRDDLESHEKFRVKFDLSIPLLSDTDGTVCQDYGVWVEKVNFGRKYMGIERTTFLIDDQGVVQRKWSKVRAKGHADEVLQALPDRKSGA